MQNIFLTASDQVAQNITGLALGNGFQLPDNDTRSIWSDKIRAHVQKPPNLNADQDPFITEFFDSLLQVERIRNEFVRQLKRVVKNPRMYGVNRDWKETQREAIEAIIQDISTWITRPLIQVPTGVGKSMIWAGIMRAYYDTLRVFGLENHFEIILLTSRINIADQMVAKKIGTDKVSDEYQEDEAIAFGDITMWFTEFKEDQIRVLAGNSQNKKEIEKKATITIMCFPALTAKNMSRFFRKKTGLVVVDESHRLSNRVRIVCENFFHTAFFIGGSATTKGAKHNNPFKFFEAVKPQQNKDGGVVPYEERLTYWAPISLCIERKELKKVRYINAVTSFDLSSLPKTSHGFSEKKAGQLVSENISVMKAILESMFLKNYPILDMVGSKKPIERKWLVFVRLISIAEELAEYCNETLFPKIRKKYGKTIQFKADFVSGRLNRNSFNSRMEAYEEGTTTIMFNSAKLGEGSDVPTINGIVSFNPYSKYAQWKLSQEIGRGTRFVENDDLLFIDGVFNSTVHDLASGLTLFGVHNYFPGGLVAGLQGEREVETKVINLLQEGLSYKQVWSKLTKKEKELVPFLERLAFHIKSKDIRQVVLPDITVSENEIKSIGFIEKIRVHGKNFLSYEALKLEVQKAGISRRTEYTKEQEKNDNWPAQPWAHLAYKGKYSSNDFFNSIEILKYEELKKEVRAAGIHSYLKYDEEQKKHDNWPPRPDYTYRGKYSFDDFYAKYLSYEELKQEVQALGITSMSQYYEEQKKHDDWIAIPWDYSKYKDQYSTSDFFNKKVREKVLYLSYEDLKSKVQKAGITKRTEYTKEQKKYPNWPSQPWRKYKNEYTTKDFFGKEVVVFLSYSDLRSAVQATRINNTLEYDEEQKKHPNWPSRPWRTYKDQYSLEDFFGKNK